MRCPLHLDHPPAPAEKLKEMLWQTNCNSPPHFSPPHHCPRPRCSHRCLAVADHPSSVPSTHSLLRPRPPLHLLREATARPPQPRQNSVSEPRTEVRVVAAAPTPFAPVPHRCPCPRCPPEHYRGYCRVHRSAAGAAEPPWAGLPMAGALVVHNLDAPDINRQHL